MEEALKTNNISIDLRTDTKIANYFSNNIVALTSVSIDSKYINNQLSNISRNFEANWSRR